MKQLRNTVVVLRAGSEVLVPSLDDVVRVYRTNNDVNISILGGIELELVRTERSKERVTYWLYVNDEPIFSIRDVPDLEIGDIHVKALKQFDAHPTIYSQGEPPYIFRRRLLAVTHMAIFPSEG